MGMQMDFPGVLEAKCRYCSRVEVQVAYLKRRRNSGTFDFGRKFD